MYDKNISAIQSLVIGISAARKALMMLVDIACKSSNSEAVSYFQRVLRNFEDTIAQEMPEILYLEDRGVKLNEDKLPESPEDLERVVAVMMVNIFPSATNITQVSEVNRFVGNGYLQMGEVHDLSVSYIDTMRLVDLNYQRASRVFFEQPAPILSGFNVR